LRAAILYQNHSSTMLSRIITNIWFIVHSNQVT
jgi:hypothetical protein